MLNTIFYNDVHDDLFWNCSGPYAPITFFINCSDVFWWATADTVKVTPKRLPVLKQAYKDGGSIYGSALFAARVRGMRPQQPYIDRIEDEKIKELFIACGPERTPDDQEMWSPSVSETWSKD